MPVVSPLILEYWAKAFGDGDQRHEAMVLERYDGSRQIAVKGVLAERVDLSGTDTQGAMARLTAAGVSFHDPDFLFYLPADASFYLSADAQGTAGVGEKASSRQLGDDDRPTFEAFLSEASEQDKEDAWVEFDHWAVFGSFEGDRLVSAASLVRWPDGPIADLGVLTLPDARGRGHARSVVRAIGHFARTNGQEVQYRCQVDNHASVALAKACRLVLFGRWIVAESG